MYLDMEQKSKFCNFVNTLNAPSQLLTSLYVLHIFRMLGILHAGVHIEFPRSNLTATPAWREKTSNKQARV